MFMRNIASKPILSVFLYAGLGLQAYCCMPSPSRTMLMYNHKNFLRALRWWNTFQKSC